MITLPTPQYTTDAARRWLASPYPDNPQEMTVADGLFITDDGGAGYMPWVPVDEYGVFTADSGKPQTGWDQPAEWFYDAARLVDAASASGLWGPAIRVALYVLGGDTLEEGPDGVLLTADLVADGDPPRPAIRLAVTQVLDTPDLVQDCRRIGLDAAVDTLDAVTAELRQLVADTQATLNGEPINHLLGGVPGAGKSTSAGLQPPAGPDCTR